MLSVYQLRRILAYFFLLTYLVLLGITWDSIDFASARSDGPLVLSFAIAVWLTYGLIYLLPALFVTWLTEKFVHRERQHGHKAVLYPLAILSTAATTLFFYANTKLYALYGFFINSFVINLVATPGGIESLGASSASYTSFAGIALLFLLLQVALLGATIFAYRKFGEPQWVARYFFTGLAILFLVATVGERVVYAYSSATGLASVSAIAQKVPYYLPFTARGLLAKLGVKVDRNSKINIKRSVGNLNYPLNPLEVIPPAKPYNIVWLVSESWRADMLDAEIMPNTWAFAQTACRFTRHYSGGNGTRVGVFTMMTGLPGNYWFPFLAERRGAAIIDVLKAQNYQLSLYTSAKFSYPEFDASIFSQVPNEQLHEIPGGGAGWEKDRQNVTNLLKFIDERDRSRPFFAFMFFESPHARYNFPPESVIRKPFADDINYFTLDKDKLTRDITLIKNRYINAVHHLDSQFARIIDYLKTNDLLGSTIVVILGDHGEEFMENGRWGHNSAFTDQQIQTPLVIWVPGRKPEVISEMTSHIDVIPTLMPLLGVKNPTRDYSSGIDLFSGERRKYAVLAEWSGTAYIDDDVKISMPLALVSSQHPRITGPHDEALPEKEREALFARKAARLNAMMEELGRYLKKGNK